jgi:hypothetical protein
LNDHINTYLNNVTLDQLMREEHARHAGEAELTFRPIQIRPIKKGI